MKKDILWGEGKPKPEKIVKFMIKRFNVMENQKEQKLLENLRRLEESEQEKVLSYARELLEARQMEENARASEQAIREGRVKTYDQFKKDFEAWQANKRKNIR